MTRLTSRECFFRSDTVGGDRKFTVCVDNSVERVVIHNPRSRGRVVIRISLIVSKKLSVLRGCPSPF